MKKPVTWNGVEYPSMNEAAEALCVKPSTVWHRARKGYTCDEDLTKPLIRNDEKFCRTCGEWWPATTEFFYWNHQHNTFRACCKACVAENGLRNLARRCNVSGCDQPRHPSGRFALCTEHKREKERERRLRYLQRRKERKET
ncbi:MAG: hypothetical protein OHK0046_47460 [Anaerolineae bacterium]